MLRLIKKQTSVTQTHIYRIQRMQIRPFVPSIGITLYKLSSYTVVLFQVNFQQIICIKDQIKNKRTKEKHDCGAFCFLVIIRQSCRLILTKYINDYSTCYSSHSVLLFFFTSHFKIPFVSQNNIVLNYTGFQTHYKYSRNTNNAQLPAVTFFTSFPMSQPEMVSQLRLIFKLYYLIFVIRQSYTVDEKRNSMKSNLRG